jgi:DNA topoisomerase I
MAKAATAKSATKRASSKAVTDAPVKTSLTTSVAGDPPKTARVKTPKKPSGKILVVVESPAKAKTINKYLGPSYVVKASLGHVKDLPSKALGVDVERNFRPTYIPLESRSKILTELRSSAKNASAIYLAADPDREGEAICQHLAEELSNGAPIHRVLFNEITKSAIQEAFRHPGEINEKLVDAQQTRRILDRLVGYKVSPLLWDKVRRGLSAGRVQTVAMRFIVEREREIRAFQKEEYWTMAARVAAGSPPPFEARLIRRAGTDYIVRGESKSGSIQAQVERGRIRIGNEGEAAGLRAELEKQNFVVASTATKETRRNPMPPFVTARLQQDASRKLGFTAKRTMGLAQKLYEGVEIGEDGATGLITYMRTDSTRVSDTALNEVRTWIGSSFGPAYLPASANFYRSKKGAQDAHEAIRPTSADRTPEKMAKFLEDDALKLYRLIWQRFVASQMTQAVFDQTTIEIKAGDFEFRATGSVPKFDGFLKVYEESKDQKDDEDDELGRRLPAVQVGESLRLEEVLPEKHDTEPPPRYNEASLVKELEEDGIGRPSTYATILSTIQEREYVEKIKGKFVPTELGMVVTELLVVNFADIFDPRYTAKLEESLDDIEDGKQEWVDTLTDFYRKFSKDLAIAEKEMADIKRMERPTDLICDRCGKPMVIKWGRNGSFIACTGYPECTNTRDLAVDVTDLGEGAVPDGDGEPAEKCENCGKDMVLKRGRFGQFYACSGYPECKTTKKIGQTQQSKPPVPIDEKCPQCSKQLVIRQGRYGEFTSCSGYPKCKYIKQDTTGVKCPECKQGDIVQKRSKRGAFYSCNRYPKCKTTMKYKPLPQPCPKCKSEYLFEKPTKDGGTVVACPNDECDFEKAAA